MKTATLKYILLIALCLAGLLIIFRDHIPFGKGNTEFAVKQGTEITGIDLLQGDRKVILRKSGEEWTVNKSAEARKTAVLFLIKTLQELSIKSPVSAEVFKSEIIDKKTEPVRVTVYHRSRPVKSFYVYKTTSNLYGNIMKMRTGSKPYIVYMPGYEDNIGSHFIADELFWTPFSAFSLLPSQIRSIKMEIVNDQAESYSIGRNGGKFFLSNTVSEPKGLDSVRLKRYITYFTSVSFESWAFDLPDAAKNEIRATAPAYRITVVTTEGKEDVLTVWDRYSDEGKKEKDTDRVWAEKNDGRGLFVLRYFDLDPILKKKSWFYGS
jgi:hypothetical protein